MTRSCCVLTHLRLGPTASMRRPAGRLVHVVVDEGDLVVGTPEEPNPVVGTVAQGRVLGGAIEEARGHCDSRVLLLVRHEVLATDPLQGGKDQRIRESSEMVQSRDRKFEVIVPLHQDIFSCSSL